MILKSLYQNFFNFLKKKKNIKRIGNSKIGKERKANMYELKIYYTHK